MGSKRSSRTGGCSFLRRAERSRSRASRCTSRGRARPSRWAAPTAAAAAATTRPSGANAGVLEAHTEPRVAIELVRDGADNWFVRSKTGGRHRLIWLTDAPQSYFAGELPRAHLSDEPSALLRRLPARLERRVAQVLARIG